MTVIAANTSHKLYLGEVYLALTPCTLTLESRPLSWGETMQPATEKWIANLALMTRSDLLPICNLGVTARIPRFRDALSISW